MKKGEMSLAVIIAAAIGLLVLVILAVLILRSGTGVTTGTGCEGTGGTCAEDCGALGEQDGSTYAKDITKSGRSGNCKEGQVCCVLLMRGSNE